MEPKPIIEFSNRNELRNWLMHNHDSQREALVVCNRSGKSDREGLPYLDVVYEALCFGWIDSTVKTHTGFAKMINFAIQKQQPL